jgi:L-ascorbate metabolism protein UlaG (beta-lactamase superfamily)
MCMSECCSVTPIKSASPDPTPGAAADVLGAATLSAAAPPGRTPSPSSAPNVGLTRRHVLAGAAGLAGSLALPRLGWARSPRFGRPADSGCRDLTPALVGGRVPTDASSLTVRWLGCTNFELAYRGQVILLDAYYDRGPRNRPIGFTPDQVRRADAVFIGHGHGDHMSDAVQVSAQTGATVVGAPVTMDRAFRGGLPASRGLTVTGRGGERLRFNGFTVEPILGHHSILPGAVIAAFRQAISTVIGNPTPEEAAAEAAIFARGTSDPRVITEGTIAYLFEFDSGFKLIYRNSAGPITDDEREAMARVGRTDVAIVAYIGQYVADVQTAVTLPLVELYNPAVYLPAHHDEIAGIFLDMGTEPLFMAIRDARPQTTSISPLYRTPVCFNVRARKPDDDDDDGD